MPELPEVETARRLAHTVAVGRRIVGVTVAADPIVFERVSPGRIRRALLGRRVRAVRRHGKHFWFELDRRPWLSVHFGMAGGLHTTRQSAVRLVSSGRRAESGWPPRFTKLSLVLAGGHELAIADGRRLGRVRLRRDPRSAPPISDLGFDALHGLPSPARFRALARARTSAVKALLLDQSFAAGVGQLDRRRSPVSGQDPAPAPGASALRRRARPAAAAAPLGRPPGGPGRRGQRSLPADMALPSALGSSAGRHRARRSDSPRDDCRPHDRVGARRAALSPTIDDAPATGTAWPALRPVLLRAGARSGILPRHCRGIPRLLLINKWLTITFNTMKMCVRVTAKGSSFLSKRAPVARSQQLNGRTGSPSRGRDRDRTARNGSPRALRRTVNRGVGLVARGSRDARVGIGRRTDDPSLGVATLEDIARPTASSCGAGPIRRASPTIAERWLAGSRWSSSSGA